jgi:ATP-dependent DNA helicase PIF1
VFNKNKEIYKDIDTRLIIESNVFNNEFKKNENIIILKENFRQKGNPIFIDLLERIRNGTFTEQDIILLESRKILPNTNNHIHIVSTNKKAQLINDSHLENLKVKTFKYKAVYKSTGKSQELRDLLLKELQYQFTLKGIHELLLKKGCRVMLIKNLNIDLGLVNGALGTIIEMEDKYPIVQFDNGQTKTIDPVEWDISIDGCKAISTQIPLMLSYASTVHRIQGSTIDSAIIDIEDAFLDHQVYVAISRVKTLDGLYFKSFNPKKIKVNKKTTEYLQNL